MLETSYLVVINGKPEGPFLLTDLQKLSLSEASFVKPFGFDDYKEIREIPALAMALGLTPQFTANPHYFAGPDVRLLASVIDYILLLLLDVIILLLILPSVQGEYLRIAIPLSSLLLLPVFKLMLGICMEPTSLQGTPGKYWLGIKVTDTVGSRLPFAKSIVRNIAKLLSIFSLGMGYFYAFFDKKHRMLHDILAGTLVIKERLI